MLKIEVGLRGQIDQKLKCYFSNNLFLTENIFYYYAILLLCFITFMKHIFGIKIINFYTVTSLKQFFKKDTFLVSEKREYYCVENMKMNKTKFKLVCISNGSGTLQSATSDIMAVLRHRPPQFHVNSCSNPFVRFLS